MEAFSAMKNIHFIGIGGISMSGIAQILSARGYRVTGSDLKETEITEHLISLGIPVAIGQRAENITEDMDTIVYTAAVKEDNEELRAARALAERVPGTRVIERAVLLGDLFDEYGVPVAVAGTHGKTSTSSMISYIYMQAGKDPTVAIGGILQNLGENFRVGNSSYMIIEACEYMDSFLHFHPKVSVITNIEAEHLDYFQNFDNIKASFRKYVEGMRPAGTLIVGKELAGLFSDFTGRLWTVSLKAPADILAADITPHMDSVGASFDVIFKGENLGRVDLYVPGHHLIYDALCAIGAALADGIAFDDIKKGIASYRSTKKRFEFKGQVGGVTVVDDYAHHPSEIRATLEAAHEVPHRELYVVFQPHTFSRTKSFLPQFAEALSAADHVVLAKIFPAREKDPGDISSQDIADLMTEKGCDATYIPDFDGIENFLMKNLSPGDLLITMGAGDVVSIGESLLGH